MFESITKDMIKKVYFFAVILGLVFINCTREDLDTKIIETKTSLSFIDISNYHATNTSHISGGYTKNSFTKVGAKNYKSYSKDYLKPDTKNKELFFDSTQFTFLRKIEKSNFLNSSSFDRLVRSKDISITTEFPELKKKELKLLSVSSKLDKKLFLTLEIPTNSSLNWSLIKIWVVPNNTNIPQVHSVMFAKANNFESIAYKDGSVYLKENDLVYRVELNTENRFHKNMNVFVSMFMETI